MQNIRIIESEDGHRLTVDGHEVEEARIAVTSSAYWLELGYDVPAILRNVTLRSLASAFSGVTLEFGHEAQMQVSCTVSQVVLILDQEATPERFELCCWLYFDLTGWVNPYSIRDFIESLQSRIAVEPTILEVEFDGGETTVRASLAPAMTVEDVILLVSELLTFIRQAEESLRRNDPAANSLTIAFDFPPEIKVACEQYLVYFVQFLSDLGIDADSELKQEANKVLFSVTATDPKQALEVISDALAIYLQLPSAPDFYRAQEAEIAIAQLSANVLHLRSQLMLTQATIQAKDATIAAKQDHIEGLQSRLDLTTFIPAPVLRQTTSPSDTESVIKDLVSVKEYEFKFLRVNVPEILRMLKRRFR
jgi:hypothetical protein